MQELCRKIFYFYRDGFVGMGLGRTLWLIILVKLFLLFCIVKPFLLPNILQTRFRSDAERAAFVFGQLNSAASSIASDLKTTPSTSTTKQTDTKCHPAIR